MILVDTSIWVDHLRRSSRVLETLIEGGRVLVHPFVVGEIALGGIRQDFVDNLQGLPQAPVADHDEVFGFIQDQKLAGRGIGYVDVHLLASARLMGDAQVWTLDRNLRRVAGAMGISARLTR